jgi:uncharacterized protein (TIGR03663 family)
MKAGRVRIATFFLIGAMAASLRFWNLGRRPMHTDEAVHAVKFGALLEGGEYSYDPVEYHGPTLNYFTLIPALMRGEKSLTAVDETTLRIVPAVFGIGLLLLLLPLVRGLGWGAVLWAAVFTAVSPAMVFYSRYYIQETLFIFFTFGLAVAGYRWLRRPSYSWAVAAGSFAGLMHATKETCIIPWGAMAVSLAVVTIASGKSRRVRPVFPRRHVAAALFFAALVSALFMSSFFTHPRGIVDSILTYRTYFLRAAANPSHVHSWTYYFHLLGYWRNGSGPAWSELLILLLSLAGIAAALRREPDKGRDLELIRFLAIYAVLMTAVYSLIPYKTPWNLLGFHHGLIILAAIGADFLFERIRGRAGRVALSVLVLAGTLHLAVQSILSIGRYDCDPRNPYVYAHPDRDVLEISRAVHRAAAASPEGSNLAVTVAFPNHDYWPLPWYFRDLPNTGWYGRVDENAPAAPLILAASVFEKDVISLLYETPPPGERPLYIPLFSRALNLRPGAEIEGYLRKDMWDRMETTLAGRLLSEEAP